MRYLLFIFSLVLLSISSCKQEEEIEEFNPAYFYTKDRTVLLTEDFDNNDLGWDITIDSTNRESWGNDLDTISLAKIENGILNLQARRFDKARASLALDEQLVSSNRFICFDIEFAMFRNVNLYTYGSSHFYFIFNGVKVSIVYENDTYLVNKSLHILYDTKLQKVYTAIENGEAVENEIFQISNFSDSLTTPLILFEALSYPEDMTGAPAYGDTDVKKIVIYTLK